MGDILTNLCETLNGNGTCLSIYGIILGKWF